MCGADLAGAEDLGVRYSRQVTGLPEARAQTIQHDRHQVEAGINLSASDRASGGQRLRCSGLIVNTLAVFMAWFLPAPPLRRRSSAVRLADNRGDGPRAPYRQQPGIQP